jgi:hypothetical protein
MKSHHAMTTCPGCGCADGETPNDECWPCQTDGEARVGERMTPYGYDRYDRIMQAQAMSQSD